MEPVDESEISNTNQATGGDEEGEKSLFDKYKTIIFWGLIVAAVLILFFLVTS